MERARPALRLDETPDPDERDGARAQTETSTLDRAEAQLVWRIAARMQAEAARRLEERSSQLARGPNAEGDAEGNAPGPDAASARFDRREVESIAQEAGIDPAYIALAWREIEAERLRPETISEDGHRRASRFLGSDAERLSVTRTIRATPEVVLESMKRVLPADPYRLGLAEIVGDADRLADAALIFDVPQVMTQMTQTGGYTPFSYQMSIADLKRVVLTLHDLGDGRTEVTATVDAKYGKLRNFTFGAWLTGIAAFVGGLAGAAVAGGVSGGDPASIALGAMGGTAVPGALTFFGYRAAYVSGLKKGQRALSEMLGAVDVDARSGGAFTRPSAPPRRPGGGDDGAFLTMVAGT